MTLAETLLMSHRDDTPWSEAPLPPRWHLCKRQTRAILRALVVDRCACGAIRWDGPWRLWQERNSRRNGDPQMDWDAPRQLSPGHVQFW